MGCNIMRSNERYLSQQLVFLTVMLGENGRLVEPVIWCLNSRWLMLWSFLQVEFSSSWFHDNGEIKEVFLPKWRARFNSWSIISSCRFCIIDNSWSSIQCTICSAGEHFVKSTRKINHLWSIISLFLFEYRQPKYHRMHTQPKGPSSRNLIIFLLHIRHW